MKIGIDTREISGQKAGKGHYAKQLILHLAEIDKENQYFLYSDSDFDIDELPFNFKKLIISAPSYLWHFFVFLNLLFSNKVDVYLAPTSFIIPALSPVKCVPFVPDLVAFLPFLKKHKLKSKILEKLTLKRALKKASKAIAISYNTKKDLINHFRISGDKIAVIYGAVSESFIPIENKQIISEVLKKYNLPPKFILFVGTLEPRKNITRLIEAYFLLDETIRKECKLVIVGKKGWYYKEIFDVVKEVNLEKDVIFPGYIPDCDLPIIYNAAEVFVFPSLYEGFGLPPLEALACGTPTIVSNISSLPEVVGDAAVLVSPYKKEEIKNAIQEVLFSPSLVQKLRKAGPIQATQFSWTKTARETLIVLEEVGKEVRRI